MTARWICYLFLFVFISPALYGLPLPSKPLGSSKESSELLNLFPKSSKSFKLIYLKPESLFSSGQMSEEELTPLAQREKRYLWYHVEKEGQKGWIPADQVLIPLQFSQKVYSSFSLKLYGERVFVKGRAQCHHAPYTPLSLIKVEGYWAKVQVGKGPCRIYQALWVPVMSLRPVLQDLGKAYIHSPLPLYASPYALEAVSAIAPKGRFLKILRLEGSWYQLDYGGLRAWAPVLSVWSRFSFAQMVKVKAIEDENKAKGRVHTKANAQANTNTKAKAKAKVRENKQWYSLMSLSARGIQLWEKKRDFFTLPMDRVVSIKTSPYHFFLLPTQQNFKMYAEPHLQASFQEVKKGFHRLRRLAFYQEEWQGGEHPRQGLIWWKQTPHSPFLLQKKKTLTYEQLRKRGIFSSTFSPRRGSGVISSKGIFIYEKGRGKVWHRHPFFAKGNYPVAMDDEGSLYVGPYVSYDRGKTFVEYLNYKPLLQQLESMGLSRLDGLSISQIIPLPRNPNEKESGKKKGSPKFLAKTKGRVKAKAKANNKGGQELLLQLRVGKKIFYAFGQPQKGHFQWVHGK